MKEQNQENTLEKEKNYIYSFLLDTAKIFSNSFEQNKFSALRNVKKKKCEGKLLLSFEPSSFFFFFVMFDLPQKCYQIFLSKYINKVYFCTSFIHWMTFQKISPPFHLTAVYLFRWHRQVTFNKISLSLITDLHVYYYTLQTTINLAQPKRQAVPSCLNKYFFFRNSINTTRSA